MQFRVIVLTNSTILYNHQFSQNFISVQPSLIEKFRPIVGRDLGIHSYGILIPYSYGTLYSEPYLSILYVG